MEYLYKAIVVFVAAFIAFAVYKSRMAFSKKPFSNSERKSLDAPDRLNYFKEIELIRDKVAPRYINYNIYKITVAKNLPNELIDNFFKNSQIEYGRPSIHLPKEFFTDAGVQAIREWLLERGVSLKSDGTMSMELADYFVKETRPQAEKIVEEAIAALEKQKAG